MKRIWIMAALIAATGAAGCAVKYRGAEIELDGRMNAYSGDTGFNQIGQRAPAPGAVYGGIEPRGDWRRPGDPNYVGDLRYAPE